MDEGSVTISFSRQPVWMADIGWELSIETQFCDTRQTCADLMREALEVCGLTLDPEQMVVAFEGFEIEGEEKGDIAESWQATVKCSVLKPSIPAVDPKSMTIGKGKYLRGAPFTAAAVERHRKAVAWLANPSKAVAISGVNMPAKEAVS